LGPDPLEFCDVPVENLVMPAKRPKAANQELEESLPRLNRRHGPIRAEGLIRHGALNEVEQ
jgi:hypothetical protein